MMKRLRSWYVGLLAFLAAVFGWQYVMGASSLSWTAPTTNTDGSPLTDLASFNIYRGTRVGGPYNRIATVAATVTSYTDNSTVEGLNCYVVTAVDARNNESAPSNEACKAIDTLAPSPPTGLTAN